MQKSKVINPNFAVIRAFDIIYLCSVVFSPFLFLFGSENWFFIAVAIPGGGIFLARWILAYSGYKLKPQAEAIVNGNQALAAWNLSPAQLDEFAVAESKRQSFDAQTGFLGLLFAGIIAAALNLIPLAWWQGALLGAGLGTFGVILSKIHRRIYLKKLKNSPGDVFIGYTGVVIAGIYQEWDSLGRSLNKVEYQRETKSIMFDISVTSKNGTTNRKIYAPVPESEEDKVERILRAFADKYSEN